MKKIEKQPTITKHEPPKNIPENLLAALEMLPEEERALVFSHIEGLREEIDDLKHDRKSGLNVERMYYAKLMPILKDLRDKDLRDESLSPVYVCTFDLAYLSYFNQAKIGGHDAGDEAIRQVGAAINNNFVPELSFRTGGDEFTTVIEGSRDSVIKSSNVLEETIKNVVIGEMNLRVDYGFAHPGEALKVLENMIDKIPDYVERRGKSRESLLAEFTLAIADRRAIIVKMRNSTQQLINLFESGQENKEDRVRFLELFGFMKKGAGVKEPEEIKQLAQYSGNELKVAIAQHIREALKAEDRAKVAEVAWKNKLIADLVDDEVLG